MSFLNNTDRVLLFSLENDEIKVTVEAYFDNDGHLVVEGYDIGKRVEEYWGDSDYEYSTTVKGEELEKLHRLFNLARPSEKELLLEIQRRYHTNTCYSEFQDLLEKNKVKYEGFSWR